MVYILEENATHANETIKAIEVKRRNAAAYECTMSNGNEVRKILY